MLRDKLIPHFSWQELVRDTLTFGRSWTFRIALLCFTLGCASWFSQHSHPPSTHSNQTLPTTTTSSSSSSDPTPPTHLQPDSPPLFRFGAGYLGGFLIGYAFRKFIKLTSLLATTALALLATLKGLGWLDLDWTSLESHIHQSLAWLHGQAEAFKVFLTGYLPSAGASGYGIFRGLRWRP